MIKGMLAGLYGETEASIQSSLPMGDSVCITAVEAWTRVRRSARRCS